MRNPFPHFDLLADKMRAGRTTPMAMDAYWTGDRLQIELEVPGVYPESIELRCDNHVLAVHAERRPRPAGVEMIVHEQSRSTYSREVILDQRLDTSRIEARYEDGVLRVSIPVGAARAVDVVCPSGSDAVSVSGAA
jgi:HSP20 family protein